MQILKNPEETGKMDETIRRERTPTVFAVYTFKRFPNQKLGTKLQTYVLNFKTYFHLFT